MIAPVYPPLCRDGFFQSAASMRRTILRDGGIVPNPHSRSMDTMLKVGIFRR